MFSESSAASLRFRSSTFLGHKLLAASSTSIKFYRGEKSNLPLWPVSRHFEHFIGPLDPLEGPAAGSVEMLGMEGGG